MSRDAARRLLRPVGRIAVALALALGLFGAGEAVERVAAYGDGLRHPGRALDDLARRLLGRLPRPRDERALLRAGLPVYDLRIRAGALRRLHRTIDAVRAVGNMTPALEPAYERAYFLSDGQWMPIRVKLRGWTANHFDKVQPSLRLRFPSRRLFQGKRQINLVDPYDKFLTADATTAWEAAHHGIPVWDSRFVVLRLNDEVRGLYLEIEQPGLELIERHDRGEGPIVSPNGKLYGQAAFAHPKAALFLRQLAACTDPLAPAPHCTWPFFAEHFDVDKLAWAAALMGLTGHWGAWIDDNLRYYFDSSRGRFEPIPWDFGYFALAEGTVTPGEPPLNFPEGSIVGDGEALTGLGVVLMRQPEFRQLRDERVWTLSEERLEPMIRHAEDLFRSLEQALAHDLRRLGPGAARAMHEDFVSTLRANAALLRRRLSAHDLSVSYAADAGDREVRLRAENRGKAAIEIDALLVRDSGGGEERRLEAPVAVPGQFAGTPGVAAGRARFPEDGTLVGVVARNLATGARLEPDAVHLAAASGPIALPPATIPRAPELPQGLRWDGDRISLGPGRVDLRESLELPEGRAVVLQAGLDLRLAGGVSLVVQGDLEGRGTPDRPVRISPLEPGAPWGTLAVLGTRRAPRRVVLEHLLAEGGGGGESSRIVFTGALAVHDGIVSLRDVTLRGMQAEDALNVRYGEVSIEGCRIEDVVSDAIDLDFCTGTIAACSIQRAGGDGIDLSGSRMTLERNEIVAMGDKGISVGERTQATIRDHRIAQGTTGVAVKDASHAEIEDSRILDEQVGIAVYVKKRSFGGGSAVVRGTTFERVRSTFLRDPESSLVIDGLAVR